MAEVRYGHVEGPGKGREYELAASQYFHRLGGKFVYGSANGRVTMCASTNTKVRGWAVAGKHTSGYDSWMSSSTAGNDKVFVIYGVDDVFEMPYHGTATVLLIHKGLGILNATGTSTGETTIGYTTKQYAFYGAATASPLECVDVDTDNSTVKVKIKASAKQ